MTSNPRILLGGLFHETHSFVPDPTTAADFRIRRGAEILTRRGDGSTIDGFLEVAETEGWTVVPVADFGALPAGLVDHAVFETFCTEMEKAAAEAIRNDGLDGIWLALHGAMITTQCEDPEGELLRRLRRISGAETLPLFGVFDLHATFTPAMARYADGLVAYRENPHTDAHEAAKRSARFLARALQTRQRPRMATRSAPIVWPPTGTGTADRPMRDLESLARKMEAENPDLWAVNVVGGYAFADVPEAGVSFSVITTGPDDAAAALLDQLVETAISLQDFGLPREWDLEAALDEALKMERGPVILVEPSDNIGGGAPGDGTAVLRALLRRGVRNGAVVIADREAVASLADIPIGGRCRVKIGGKGSPLDEGPVDVEAVLVSRSDGRFTLEDRNSHLAAAQGTSFDMGPSAVLRIGEGLTVLLTSRKTPPFDLGQLRSQGIEPEALRLIGVKAAVAHRRAYDPIAAASFTVATPGPCTSDLQRLPYRRIRRPIFPLDQAGSA
jgi:microcystin degradation protein MlrC